ncbi:hypothetical protein EI94DRAFT_1811105 [Lactarius quietus]|nr:hypothetical protein EI94DRAFT_1811105 [Lactarius quietus]
MSLASSELGDAVQSDGTLKDASDMDWSYDADDSIPFPLANTSHNHSLFSGKHTSAVPIVPISGIRRTTQKVVINVDEDANADVEADAVTGANLDDSDDDSDGGATMEPDDDDFEALKAMADADNQACSPPLSRFDMLRTDNHHHYEVSEFGTLTTWL